MRAEAATGPVIRPATRADLPRLGRLGALLVEEHHAFDEARFPPTRNRTPADYAAFLVEQIDDPNVFVLVADDRARPRERRRATVPLTAGQVQLRVRRLRIRMAVEHPRLNFSSGLQPTERAAAALDPHGGDGNVGLENAWGGSRAVTLPG